MCVSLYKMSRLGGTAPFPSGTIFPERRGTTMLAPAQPCRISFAPSFCGYSLEGGCVWIRDPRKGHRLLPGVKQAHQVGETTTNPSVPFPGLVLQVVASLGQPQAFVLKVAETSPDLSPAL